MRTAARTEILGRVLDARRYESARRADRETSPARRLEIDAMPWIETARTAPDGTFRFEMHVYSCRATGGLFTREDEPFVPPRYRSLWVVTDGDLVASVEIGAEGLEARTRHTRGRLRPGRDAPARRRAHPPSSVGPAAVTPRPSLLRTATGASSAATARDGSCDAPPRRRRGSRRAVPARRGVDAARSRAAASRPTRRRRPRRPSRGPPTRATPTDGVSERRT